MFIVAAFAAAFAVFLLGAFKSQYTGQRWWAAGFAMLVNGATASALAYLLGFGLDNAFAVKGSVGG